MDIDDDESTLHTLRDEMVTHQLRGADITDPRVLRAMAKIPRHLFVPDDLCWRAYEDRPLPIGMGQTISQPYIVAKMTEALDLTGGERVLDIGTGSGYQAAVLGELSREVWSVEIIPELARRARSTLGALGYDNVHVVIGDGSLGLVEHAPYDAILVAAASPALLPTLLGQLGPSGRLVIPVGGRDQQTLMRFTRAGRKLTTESLGLCAFVPLTGENGWSDDRAGDATV
ncbi:MAG TPA: protein-L-isoaspartate(D-aspartate) O-methyltransferase [Polyangiaceae bacterium]|nr:protein-L-isoaspartate(D-aspartate) O-methyltransferase [Polyangiaceae bacterium]